MNRLLLIATAVGSFALAASGPLIAPASALPFFSRQYRLACADCHVAFPRLSTAGIAFRQNGYRQPGDPGEAPWSRRPLPCSATATLAVLQSPSRGGRGVSSREWSLPPLSRRVEVGVHGAGTLAPRLTFLVHGRVTDGGRYWSDGAFLQVDDLVPDGGLNVRAGVFTTEFPFLSTSRRTTLHSYLAPVSLASDGVELNGARSGWTYGSALVDSRHLEDPDRFSWNFDRLKDAIFWLMRDWGGQRLGVRMLFDRQPSNVPRLSWVQHLQAMASAQLTVRQWTIVPGYVFDRFDDRPAPGVHNRFQYLLLETVVPLGGARRYVVTARAEHMYRTKTTYSPEEDHHLAALDLSAYLAPGTRASLGASYGGDNVGGPQRWQLSVALQGAY